MSVNLWPSLASCPVGYHYHEWWSYISKHCKVSDNDWFQEIWLALSVVLPIAGQKNEYMYNFCIFPTVESLPSVPVPIWPPLPFTTGAAFRGSGGGQARLRLRRAAPGAPEDDHPAERRAGGLHREPVSALPGGHRRQVGRVVSEGVGRSQNNEARECHRKCDREEMKKEVW